MSKFSHFTHLVFPRKNLHFLRMGREPQIALRFNKRDVGEREWESVDGVGEQCLEGEVLQKRREETLQGMVEVEAEKKVCEVRGEVFYWLIKHVAKSQVGEGVW